MGQKSALSGCVVGLRGLFSSGVAVAGLTARQYSLVRVLQRRNEEPTFEAAIARFGPQLDSFHQFGVNATVLNHLRPNRLIQLNVSVDASAPVLDFFRTHSFACLRVLKVHVKQSVQLAPLMQAVSTHIRLLQHFGIGHYDRNETGV